MLAMLAVMLLAAVGFARLGVWQLDRAVERGEARAAAEAATAAGVPATPIDDVLPPQTTFRSTMVTAHVAAEGEYEADQLVVTGRVADGRPVELVLAPFRVASSGALIAVVRGWRAAGSPVPAPPDGQVALTGWLQAGEGGGELAGSTTDAISPAQLVNRWGGPMYTGYLVLEQSGPADGLPSLGLPEERSRIDWRSLGYALQWWIFGLLALGLWWRMVRDEAASERAQEPGRAPDPGRTPEAGHAPEPAPKPEQARP